VVRIDPRVGWEREDQSELLVGNGNRIAVRSGERIDPAQRRRLDDAPEQLADVEKRMVLAGEEEKDRPLQPGQSSFPFEGEPRTKYRIAKPRTLYLLSPLIVSLMKA
jgi:hypothetical protein